MGITNPTLSVNNKTIFSHTKPIQLPSLLSPSSSPSPSLSPLVSSSTIENSMSEDYHQHQQHQHQQQPPTNQQQGHVSSIFNFPNGFDRSTEDQSSTTVDPTGGGLNPVYESAGMLSEMFNFGTGPGNNAGPPAELLDYQRTSVGGIDDTAHTHHEWYGDQHNDPHQHHNQIGGAINAHNSAAAMQLFMTNAPPRSPSPPPQPQPPTNLQSVVGGFNSLGVVNTANNPNFWHHQQHHPINNPGELTGIIESQGLSLSLSSSLQQFEAKHAEDNQIMFFNQHQQAANSGVGPSSSNNNVSSNTHFFKNLTNAPGPQAHHPITLHSLQPVGGFAGPSTSSVGFGSASTSGSLGVVNVLRNSKYAKPAQELLEEFCSVGRGHQFKKPKLGQQNSGNNPNSATGSGGGGVGSSSSKEPPQLSPSDRIDHQRRKVKLLAMLDEVDRRYNHYCEQMQMVVNSFDLVMGYGGAIPYTALAQKAMSRHFRCLKDAIHAQVKHSCELLGEKDPTASSGLTKGETPRLKMLEQSLRQQRAFHQMGMMDQEAWRPQRGLPERSVNILRAWLFEHFLHPYPSDADKHLLARQTGLSRNQVSNWFINARVRLWKPMVEEMYQQEAKDREDDEDDDDEQNDEIRSSNQTSNTSFTTTQSHSVAENPITSSVSATTMLSAEGQRSIDTIQPSPLDSDPSINAMNRHQQQHVQSSQQHAGVAGLPSAVSQAFLQGVDDTCQFGSDGADDVGGPTTMIRFGAASGDVSLTLGLRHSGNAPEKSASFSVRDFGSS